MSTVKANAIIDASGGNTATINSMTPTADSLQGFRNRIINGDMGIDQRNNGASVAVTSELYTLDRWYFANTVAGKLTCQQNSGSVTPPTGFSNYLGVVSQSAYSVLTSDLFALKHSIEGFNTADLSFGTANAKTITLSFWVRSSLTGTFGASIVNNAFNRSYVFTYTVNSANTWEYKTVTIPGDTTGTWVGATNSIGIRLYWDLGAGSTYRGGTVNTWNASGLSGPTGSVSVVGTNGATFYITGVQLEVGSVATPFERRDYGREWIMCQRYCYAFTSAGSYGSTPIVGANQTTTVTRTTFSFPIAMRTSPTVTFSAANTFLVQEINGATNRTVSAVSATASSNQNIFIDFTISSGTAGASVLVYDNNANAKITVSSEL
jgi:hypothetical protein